jgi:hypothetical protein
MPKPSKEVKERRRSEVRNAPSLAALWALERQRNYKPGWAERIHAARLDNKKPGGMPPGFYVTGNENADWSGL